MYLHLGQSVVVPFKDVIGIFDLDNTTSSHITRTFLNGAQREGKVKSVGEELPKSFTVCTETHTIRKKRTLKKRDQTKIYISQLATATLRGRGESKLFEE